MQILNKSVTVFILIILLLLVYTGINSQVFDLHSDSLVLYEKIKDLQSFQTFEGWKIGGHSYLFPDGLLMFILLNLSSNYIFVNSAFMFITCFSLLSSLFLIFKYRLQISNLLILFYLTVITYFINTWYGSMLLPSGSHSTVFIMTLLTVCLLHVKENHYKMLLFVLFLFAFSDKLAVTYILLPLAFVNLVFKKNLKLFLLLMAISFIPILIVDSFNQFLGFEVIKIPRGNITNSIKLFVEGNIKVFFLKKPYEGIFILSGHLYITVVLFFKNNPNNARRDVLGFMFFSSWITFFSAFISGYYIDIYSIRYYLPFQFFGHIGFILLLSHFDKKRIVTILLFAILLSSSLKKIGRSEEYFTAFLSEKILNPQKECLERVIKEYSLKRGIAEYWYNRKLFIDRNIEVIQVTSKFQKYDVLINKRKYQHLDILSADFIIKNNIEDNFLNKVFDKSRLKDITTCDGLDISLIKN